MEKCEVKVAYNAKVDLTFKSYSKALEDCITLVSQNISCMSSFGADFQREMALLNMLVSQHLTIVKFVSEYCQLEESI